MRAAFFLLSDPAVPCANQVLNLLSQVGNYLSVVALPEGYYIPSRDRTPLVECWLKTGVAHHEHSRALADDIVNRFKNFVK